MRIRLGDADRERLGCPEWLEYDPSRISAREAAVLQKYGSYDSPLELGRAWRAQIGTGADGKPAMVRTDFDAWLAVVWIALYRAGVKVTYPDLDFDFYAMRTQASEGEVPEGDAQPAADSADTRANEAGVGPDGGGKGGGSSTRRRTSRSSSTPTRPTS